MVSSQNGNRQLSDRQKEVLLRISHGETQAEIAEAMFLSRHTIRDALRAVYGLLNVQRQAEAVAYALRNGLIR
jgi:DNA-binding CsgD family transcriptional regulator